MRVLICVVYIYVYTYVSYTGGIRSDDVIYIYIKKKYSRMCLFV